MGKQNHRIVFTDVEQARLETTVLEMPLADDDVLVRNQWTLVSPGTELAYYTNQQDLGGRRKEPYPFYPGYAAIGVIEAVGEQVTGWEVGDCVLTCGGHALYTTVQPARKLCVRIPLGVPMEHAPFARMALITLATLRPADIQPGEWLGVVGLGLVGNLGAQFGLASGYHVVGCGRSAERSQIARMCGIPVLEGSSPEALAEEVRSLSGGLGCRFVLETTGTAAGMQSAISLAATGATISLIGVPWQAEPGASISDLLQPVFSRYLHIHGGWEWGIPLHDKDANSPNQMISHRNSIEGNVRYALDELKRGRIKIDPLIQHRIHPEQAQNAYQDLLHRRNRALAVLLDWREVGSD